MRNKILVIDDDFIQLDIMRTVLRDAGYETITSRDGEAGIEKAIEEQPDVIILDVMMPGMDGIEVCDTLSNNIKTEAIPIMFLTCRTDKPTILRGFRSGGIDYCMKPCDHEDLLARVRRLINPPSLFEEADRLRRSEVPGLAKAAAFLQVALASSRA